MLFSFPALAIILFILYAIGCAGIGAGIGAVVGLIVSLITRRGPRAIGWDALLGAVGVVVGLIGTPLMPWHQNTITERLPGGGTSISTENTYQYTERVAFVLVILLPLLFELFRLWRSRTTSRRSRPASPLAR